MMHPNGLTADRSFPAFSGPRTAPPAGDRGPRTAPSTGDRGPRTALPAVLDRGGPRLQGCKLATVEGLKGLMKLARLKGLK